MCCFKANIKLTPNLTGNMNEVPVYFDDPPNRAGDTVGSQAVNIITGHGKHYFIVVLSCMADGILFFAQWLYLNG